MIKRVLAFVALGVMLSGCFIAPMALIGPATSGFSTASLIQSGATSTLNYVVKKSTGKTIAEHTIEALSENILKQSYLPKNKGATLTTPNSKPSHTIKN